MPSSVALETLGVLRRILRASERNSRHLAAATGMIPSQLLVLQEVERRRETTPTVIATTLKFSQATMTNIVDRLVASGYLTRTRDAADRRRMVLRLTSSGNAALEAAPDLLQERFRDRFAELECWEQAMIHAALERLADLLGANDLNSAPRTDVDAIDRAAE